MSLEQNQDNKEGRGGKREKEGIKEGGQEVGSLRTHLLDLSADEGDSAGWK